MVIDGTSTGGLNPCRQIIDQHASSDLGDRVHLKGVLGKVAGPFGAMMGIQQRGYLVPRDVSVMGMDDLPQASFLNPPLTTMHIPMREIGAAALDLLRDHLSGGPTLARRIELACHLVERSSAGPAAQPHQVA